MDNITKSHQMASVESPSHSFPWIRIVIVAYNSGKYLQTCVDALTHQSMADFEAVIVDNETPDDCVDTLTLPDYRFKIVRAPKNLGFSGGSNLGLEGTKTAYVMTLNPDVHLEENCLMRLKETAFAHSNATMLAPVLLRSEDKDLVDGLGDVLSIYGIAWRGGYDQKIKDIAPRETLRIFSPCGAAAVYRTTEFNVLGGFDDAFFCYLEDVDLGLRMNATGGIALLVFDAKGFHVGGASTGQLPGFQEYYSCRNNLRMIIKSVPLAICPVMIACYLASQTYITMRNLKDPMLQHRLRGYKDAFKSIPRTFLARTQKPSYKFGASLRVAKLLAWKKSSLTARPPYFWDVGDSAELEREEVTSEDLNSV